VRRRKGNVREEKRRNRREEERVRGIESGRRRDKKASSDFVPP